MTLTELIAELERLDAAATPGPWCDAGHKIGDTYGGIAECEFDEQDDMSLTVFCGTHRGAILAHLKRLAELEGRQSPAVSEENER